VTTFIIHNSRAWQSDSFPAGASWVRTLSPDCLAALDPTIQELRRQPRPITALTVTPAQRAAARACLEPALADLEAGSGFVVLDRLALERYSAQEATALYWLLGQMLGRPFEQNVQGTLLYDVRDTGQDVRSGARFSVTNAESTFHTDNSFGDEVLDYVGLLCLATARSGGLNQIVSGYTVVQELREHHPDVLRELARPFHVDRRGGTRPGESATAHHPVLQGEGEDLVVRYLRFWIHAGHDKAGDPLGAERLRALDVLDSVLARPDLRVEFGLEPGQMLFVNNRWIFHNRTAFEDHAEPERRRHYVRLWLRRGASRC
jgi:alpha-ketoglutarate-dependent taurine dioxygenase